MTDSWSSLEGVTLAEKFQLQHLLSENGNSACFLARIAGQTQSCGWLWLALADDSTRDRQLQLWQISAGLEHPNLLHVRETGQTERGVTSMAYLLTDPADENLAEVLRQRPLNQVEAREALLSVAKALSYLHSRMLVHGKVAPSAILAVGEEIKLSADTIAPAKESGDGVLSAADDLRGLADCVHTMFTQSPDTDIERLSAIPQPFRDIVRGCYEKNPLERWTAQRIIAALDWPPVTVTATPASGARRPSLEPAPRATRNPQRSFIRIFALASAGAALLVVLLARKTPPASSAPPPTRARIVSVPNPAPPPPLAAREIPNATYVPPKQTTQPRIWRVISYTYSRAEDAARMVGEINRKFPQMQAERFFPNEDAPPYFVALGGRMTRSEAVRLRERAVSSGLPTDTFVRNFKK